MKKTIWKFEIKTDKGNIEMPKDAEILSIQEQNNKPCIWALVNPDNETEERYFELFGTGHDVPCGMGIERNFIGTFQLSGGVFVFHVFERIN